MTIVLSVDSVHGEARAVDADSVVVVDGLGVEWVVILLPVGSAEAVD